MTSFLVEYGVSHCKELTHSIPINFNSSFTIPMSSDQSVLAVASSHVEFEGSAGALHRNSLSLSKNSSDVMKGEYVSLIPYLEKCHVRNSFKKHRSVPGRASVPVFDCCCKAIHLTFS